MKLEQLLKVTDPKQRVCVDVYAYGVFYASTLFDDEMKTVECVLAQVRKDVLDAKVTFAIATTEEAGIDFTVLHIQVELCK